MILENHFENFVTERIYLKNVTQKTVAWYRQSYRIFKKFLKDRPLNRIILQTVVVEMRQAGVSSASINVYMRAINSFLTWMYENDYATEHLRVKPLKIEKKAIKTLTEPQLRLLLGWKPKGFYQLRTYTLIALLIDTGIRIEEALTLKTENVDLENLLITVSGKGMKERILPISYDLRKILYRWMREQNQELFFATKGGGKIGYNNCRRDFNALCKQLKIETSGTFHVLRHTFAYNYVRNGGNLFALQKMLGHETIQMTRRYVELQTEDLKEIHAKVSLLSRLR